MDPVYTLPATATPLLACSLASGVGRGASASARATSPANSCGQTQQLTAHADFDLLPELRAGQDGWLCAQSKRETSTCQTFEIWTTRKRRPLGPQSSR